MFWLHFPFPPTQLRYLANFSRLVERWPPARKWRPFLCIQVGFNGQHVLTYKLSKQVPPKEILAAQVQPCICWGMEKGVKIVYEVRAIASFTPPLNYDIIT